MKKLFGHNAVYLLTALLALTVLSAAVACTAHPASPGEASETAQTDPDTTAPDSVAETAPSAEAPTEPATDTETAAPETDTQPSADTDAPYASILPKPDTPPAVLVTIPTQNGGDCLASVSLQGLLAKHAYHEMLMIPARWEMNNYVELARTQYGMEVREADFWTYVGTVLSDTDIVKGFIVTDLGDDSVNVATSIAGLTDALIVTRDMADRMQGLGLTELLDVTDWTDETLRTSAYFDKLSRNVGFICDPGNNLFLRDYAVMCGGYCYSDRTTEQNDIMKAFKHMDANFLVFGWNNHCGEYGTVEALAKINGCLIPADYACNLSTLSAMRPEQLTQKTEAVTSDGAGKHTVVFILSDGDNLQWTLGDYSSAGAWFGSAQKGGFYMGWGLPACLWDAAPACMQYYYDNMTQKDEFILELSGMGYTYPSRWRSRTALAEMQRQVISVMAQTGMRYVEILDTCQFTKQSVNNFYGTLTADDAVDGIFYIDYADYAAGQGRMVWSNGKPVVSARFKLWADGVHDVDFVADSINSLPTDPKDPNAYTFVTVHAWSGLTADGQFAPNGNTLDAVRAVIDRLDGDVEVVTPDEFMKRIVKNLSQ